MSLADVYGSGRFGLSFELFPPKTESGQRALMKNVAELMEFQPSYVTCTYGAGGSTRNKTLDVVQSVKQKFHCAVASHLTCVGSTRDQLREFLCDARKREVDFIVALRGDPPQGETEFRPVADGLAYANQLVTLLRAEYPEFGIAVAGYPETHQEAPSADVDLENLKRKVDAGADVVITQLFYDNDVFLRFRDRCAAAGIGLPIVPGVLPVTNLKQIQRITSLCGAQLPEQFVTDLSASGDDNGQFQVGVDFAVRQVQHLIDQGVPGVHFYVLNKSRATATLLSSVDRPS